MKPLRLSCRLCGMVIGLAGDRITDAALTTLREHLTAVHGSRAPREPADAGDVLAHYDVEREP